MKNEQQKFIKIELDDSIELTYGNKHISNL